MSYQDPCLGPTGVGVLGEDGKLTQVARDSFTAQVIALLTSGNKDGLGTKVSTLIGVPFPPYPGPQLFDPDKLLTDPTNAKSPLFWFEGSPFASLMFDTMRDPQEDYQKLIVDTLYGSLMKALSLNGNAIAPPILDYSGFLPPEITVDWKIPEDLLKIAVALTTPTPPPVVSLEAPGMPNVGSIPDFLTALLNLPTPPAPPGLPVPPVPAFDFVIFDDLFKMLIELPATVLPQLIPKLDPLTLLKPPELADLFNLVMEPYFGPNIDILKALGLLQIHPKLLSATFVVMIQNAVIALLCLAVSQVIGTGLVVRGIGQALGLA